MSCSLIRVAIGVKLGLRFWAGQAMQVLHRPLKFQIQYENLFLSMWAAGAGARLQIASRVPSIRTWSRRSKMMLG